VTDPLFTPRGIAVVGASPKPANIGGRVLAGLRRHAYAGDLAAVNPGHAHVHDTPCFPSLGDLPFRPDLALVFVAAPRVVGVVEAAAGAGAGAAVVYSSGFSETGADGRREQERLRSAARAHGVRVLGPNCQGMVDFRRGVAATFTPAILDVDSSACASVAYVGQSGAVGGVFFDLARERGVTPTAWVSTGNEVDLTVASAARRLIEAGPVDLVCLYLEQVPDGADWAGLTGAAQAAGTRLAVLRSGRSDAGRRAAASHTGALVGDDEPFRLACARDGVPVVDDVADLVELAVATRRDPRPRGPRVGVITTSGGAGGLAADRIEAAGLRVPTLGGPTRERLRALLPAFAATGNPVDVTADLMMRRPEDLAEVCRVVADDPDIDQVLLAVTNLVGDMADRVAGALSPPSVPLSVAYLAAPDRIAVPTQRMGERGIPVHPSVRAAVDALAALSSCPAAGVVGAELPVELPDLPAGPVLTEAAATPLLDRIGVARPESVLVGDPTGLAEAVRALGGRAVLKVQSPDVLHKSELGAVAIGVDAEHAEASGARMLAGLRAALPDARIDGILVQRRAEPGTELLVGVRAGRDGWPPTVTVGIGGTAVELYGDVATAFAPLDTAAAEVLLRTLRGFPLLDGFRGRPRADLAAAADAVTRLSRLAALPGLVELEVNPLIVHAAGRGATAVDLLVRKEVTA
jgi:acyl-CoA synthetase (NDP forming)